jgi:hypothetical protein
MHKYTIITILGLFLASHSSFAQDSICLNEVLQIENKLMIESKGTNGNTSYLNYTVKSTDWENQINNSKVEVYKDTAHLHFFSDQASIYQDEDEAIVLLKDQKVIIVSSFNKALMNKQADDEFMLMRKDFLKNCEVLNCSKGDEKNDLKILELKVVKNDNSGIKISKMIYKYNVVEQKIIETRVFFNKEYKLKEMTIKYNSSETKNDYKFEPTTRYFFSKNNKLLPKYKGYELVDNRDKENKLKPSKKK